MKKIAILLAFLMLLYLCALPCCAEEASDDTIVMDGESFDLTATPDDVDGEDGTDKDATGAPDYADDISLPTTGSVIGGADGPTTILVAEADGISFHPENFVSSLSYMGTGMIGIFIVIGLIVLATVVLNKMFSDKVKKDD